MNTTCHICVKVFSWSKSLKRHLKLHQNKEKIGCNICRKGFSRADALQRHKKIHYYSNKKRKINHQAENILPKKIKKFTMKYCDVCESEILENSWYHHIRTISHKLKADILLSQDFPENVKSELNLKLDEARDQHISIKFNLELFAKFIKPKNSDESVDSEESIKSFNTKRVVTRIDRSTEINNVFEDMISVIKTQAEEFQEKDSGWSLA
ncbi:serendipity locus protein beta-like [Condylostylus longicornis]|uniref:serendipity locus protein beta-like n=1 Tax=Condylostylus longicornis TaxID=2530218 RepID=UPI00244E4BF0|nr:serendipity locus protein beta-like [Condylostylus longicornis]